MFVPFEKEHLGEGVQKQAVDAAVTEDRIGEEKISLDRIDSRNFRRS